MDLVFCMKSVRNCMYGQADKTYSQRCSLYLLHHTEKKNCEKLTRSCEVMDYCCYFQFCSWFSFSDLEMLNPEWVFALLDL